MRSKLKRGVLTVVLPDGRNLRFRAPEPGPEGTLVVRTFAFARRLIGGGDIGFAEAYIRGEWDSPNVSKFLEVFSANHDAIERHAQPRAVVAPPAELPPLDEPQHQGGLSPQHPRPLRPRQCLLLAMARRDDDLFLGPVRAERRGLAVAQPRKYQALCEKTRIGPDNHVLEIGCGWGGFAEHVARHIGAKRHRPDDLEGAARLRQEAHFEAGLADRVDIKLQDYRDETGVYDRIASIEMFEAVGKQYWSTYFGQLRDRLAPGGAAGVQVITIRDEFFDA